VNESVSHSVSQSVSQSFIWSVSRSVRVSQLESTTIHRKMSLNASYLTERGRLMLPNSTRLLHNEEGDNILILNHSPN